MVVLKRVLVILVPSNSVHFHWDHNKNGRYLSVGPNLPTFLMPYNATVGWILNYTDSLM